MGMPSVQISFSEKAITAVQRGNNGIVALLLKDKSVQKITESDSGATTDVEVVEIETATDIPSTISEENQKQIANALIGYSNPPKEVVAVIINNEVATYTEALKKLETIKFNYLAIPTVETDEQTQTVVTWIKEQRENDRLVKAVLPNTAADTEGVVNFATEKVYINNTEYTTEQYCSRIAGLLAGTDMSISATYAPLPELTDCTRLSKKDKDNAVDAGKFIIWHDGEKVKTGRAVNSLVTTNAKKGDSFKKIKIVDTMDLIKDDIKKTAQDSYLGKYPNTYNNKCLLMAAIQTYFDSLIASNILASATVNIDVAANRTYLKGRGEDVSSMSDDDLKQANTGSTVFLTAKISILDAIEDIVLPIEI